MPPGAALPVGETRLGRGTQRTSAPAVHQLSDGTCSVDDDNVDAADGATLDDVEPEVEVSLPVTRFPPPVTRLMLSGGPKKFCKSFPLFLRPSSAGL